MKSNKKELDSMEKTGVTRKVGEPMEWVTSMVVVEKTNGELRICLDPRDLNKEIKREYYRQGNCKIKQSKRCHRSKRNGFW